VHSCAAGIRGRPTSRHLRQELHVKTLFQRHAEATNRGIDRLVYELYGLTDEEIAVVEGR
jgi:hypothetical protein